MKKIIFTAMAMADILLMAGCPNGSTEEDIKSSEKSITSFKFEADNNDALSGDVTEAVDKATHTTILTVPYGTEVTALKPSISLSAGATVTPASGTAGDFTNPVSYTVMAEDDTTQVYTVTVTVELPGITLNLSGQENEESVTASHKKAASGTQITLTANNLGTGRKAVLSASGISISPRDCGKLCGEVHGRVQLLLHQKGREIIILPTM